jgi:cell wall assembly regulator SMI1
MGQMASSDSWKRIEAKLADMQPEALAALAPPIAPEKLAELEARLGFTLAKPFRDTLLVHDGAEEKPCLFGPFWFMDLANIVSHYEETKERFARDKKADDTSPWTPAFVAFGNEHSYKELLFLDAASGAVHRYSEGEWTPWSDDFGAWLSGIADDFEAGRISWNDDDQWFINDDGSFVGEPRESD